MNSDILQILAIAFAALALFAAVAAITRTVLNKRREREEKARLEEKARIQHEADKRRLLAQAEERDRKKKDIEQAEKLAKDSSLRPVRALLNEVTKKNEPRAHNQRKNPPPAPKNTISRTVNGRNETGYYDDNGFWYMLAANELINHTYYEDLRAEQSKTETPATPEPEKPAETSTPEYSAPEYSKTEYSTPDYSSSYSSSSDSSSSSSSSDSGSSYSSDSGSSGGGGDF
jgi:uncharacterized membrane protein YgcG